MKIDRHNYEEFFILYWDNELTAVQKQAVENFLNQNADLREEFEILGETRFIPDPTLQFKEKDILLNDSFINITNYEEQLLNYIDNEITTGQRKEVEKFVASNPAAQKELALLQRTKLQPEAEISFPDKSVLYRREEKVRVISMTWFRVAVAAAIMLIAGFTVFQLIDTGKENVNPVAKINASDNNPVSKEEKDPKKTPADPATIKQDQDAGVNDELVKDTGKENPGHKNKIDESSLSSTLTKEPVNKNNLSASKNVLVDDQNTTQNDAIAYINPVNLERVDKVQNTESGAINDSFTNAGVTNKPNIPLYIPEAEEKEKDGGGIKEFLRKTTRVFERRTKMQTTTEDNKLLVGAFAVSLK